MDLAQLFQSLFFWMTPIKPRHARFCRDSASVSILVLLDDSHQDTSYGEIPYIIEMFQSLFFWMTPIKCPTPTCGAVTTRGFNPCSSG